MKAKLFFLATIFLQLTLLFKLHEQGGTETHKKYKTAIQEQAVVTGNSTYWQPSSQERLCLIQKAPTNTWKHFTIHLNRGRLRCSDVSIYSFIYRVSAETAALCLKSKLHSNSVMQQTPAMTRSIVSLQLNCKTNTGFNVFCLSRKFLCSNSGSGIFWFVDLPTCDDATKDFSAVVAFIENKSRWLLVRVVLKVLYTWSVLWAVFDARWGTEYNVQEKLSISLSH